MFKGKKSKVLMISSPSLWVYMSTHIYPSIATLGGQLSPLGYKVKCCDFDIELVQDFFDLKFIRKRFNQIKNPSDNLTKKFFLYLKYFEQLKKVKDNDLKMLIRYKMFNIAFMICDFKNNQPIDYDYQRLKGFSVDEERNFFISYFKEKLKKIRYNPDVVCISSVPSKEFYQTLSLAYCAKKVFKNSKIILGGNWISNVSAEIQKHPDFFDLFCDYILIADGEESVVKIMKYLEGEEDDINSVTNLLYKNEKGQICTTPHKDDVDITKILPANYDDYDFKKYYTKNRTVSVFLTKGCYWGKCKFCNYINHKRFQVKPINQVIDEIKFYIKKYKVNQIFFVDDAIPPNYYNKLALALIENNIKITFSSFAIMDSGYTEEVFKNLAKAGLTLLQWGFETNSKRLFDLINKSGSFENRAEILKNSHNAGITNIVDIIDGLPTETFDDVLATVLFLYENIEYIDSIALQVFQMRRNSGFCDNPEKYNIEITKKQDFTIEYEYRRTDKTEKEYEPLYKFYLEVSKRKEFLKDPNNREALRTILEEFLSKYAPQFLKETR